MPRGYRLSFIVVLSGALQFVSALCSGRNTEPVWDGSIAVAIANEEGGDGSGPTRPIHITTPAELAYLAQQVNNYDHRLRLHNKTLHRNAGEGFAGTWFRLMNDIDLNGYPWTSIGTGPATDVAPSFCGTFDGGGNRVAGLFIPQATGLAGLFGFIGRNGCVQNLHVTVPQMICSTPSYIGPVAGWNDGIIRHCVASGKGLVKGGNAGGIAGMNSNRILNCYATLDVTGENSGGITAFNSADTLACCYATGSVTANVEAGGLAAYNGTNGVIKNCVALNIEGISTSGGIRQHAGRITDDNDGILTANFASPAIPGNWKRQGAASYDGSDFAVKAFHTTPGSAGPFAGWSTTAWHFDPQNIHLPALRTTDGVIIDDQPVLIRTDYTD